MTTWLPSEPDECGQPWTGRHCRFVAGQAAGGPGPSTARSAVGALRPAPRSQGRHGPRPPPTAHCGITSSGASSAATSRGLRGVIQLSYVAAPRSCRTLRSLCCDTFGHRLLSVALLSAGSVTRSQPRLENTKCKLPDVNNS